MFISATSISFPVADVVIGVFLALFLIIGFFKGFSGSLRGFMLFIFVCVLSLFIMSLLYDVTRDIDIMMQLENALLQESTNWGDIYNSPVVLKGDAYYILIDGAEIALNDYKMMEGRVASFVCSLFNVASGQTIASVATQGITGLILTAILTILCYIVIFIVLILIRRATQRLRYSDVPAFQVLDKVLGAIISCAIAFFFVLVVLSIFSALQTQLPSVIEHFESTTFTKAIFDFNPLGKMFENIFVGLPA